MVMYLLTGAADASEPSASMIVAARAIRWRVILFIIIGAPFLRHSRPRFSILVFPILKVGRGLKARTSPLPVDISGRLAQSTVSAGLVVGRIPQIFGPFETGRNCGIPQFVRVGFVVSNQGESALD